MKDFYNILGIENTASREDIKRAYFKSIRKYQPERYPKEFMEIREAYETLYDENTRKQYDDRNNLPAIVLDYYNHALKAMEQGNEPGCIALLERVREVYPDYNIINALLGEAYIANDNSGKAINIFEKLVATDPKNASFAGKLAKSYLNRGWQRKATDKYNIALTLDEDNISLWIELAYCYIMSEELEGARKVIDKGIKTSIENDWDGTELYFHALYIDLVLYDIAFAKIHLEKLRSIANKDEVSRSNVAWFLATISEQASKVGNNEFSQLFMSVAADILPDDPEMKKMNEELSLEFELDALWEQLIEDKGYDDLLLEAIEFFLNSCDDPECDVCRRNSLGFEMDFMDNMRKIKPQLNRLKREYPKLYATGKDLFDRILSAKNEDAYYNKNRKRIEKEVKKVMGNSMDEFYGDFDYEDTSYYTEPYKREGKKIGRNDPCPCGSGKKYKRCCGRT